MSDEARMHDERLRFEIWRALVVEAPPGSNDRSVGEVYEAITGRTWVRDATH